MNIIKNFNETLEIKDLGYLNEINAEITECYPNNNELCGKLYITGNYHSSKSDEEVLISKNIDFQILFDNDKLELNDIECLNLKYQVLEGIGVDLNFDIIINFSELIADERENEDESLLEKKLEQEKEIIEKNIDTKLSSKLETRCDNFPEEIITEKIVENKSVVKVIYYTNDSDLETIASNNNRSLDTLFKENKNNNFNTHKRIIINYGK